jgi:hypothetical protein
MQSDVEVILSKYATVFSGVGKLNNYRLKVHVNPDISPVAQPPRRVPFHIRKVVDKTLIDSLTNLILSSRFRIQPPGFHL